MISFHYENANSLHNEDLYREWIERVIQQEGHNINEIAYIFTTDASLLKLNIEFLGHDFYTDILTFDRSENLMLSGDIFISMERVEENADTGKISREEELRRVMVHGVLHMMGYEDKSEENKLLMRKKEDSYLKMFHVEQ